MTGRLPARTGMASTRRWVLFPDSAGGLPRSEITIARALKQKNYATAAIGKWHLGHLPEFLPTSHGFDTYFGIPYSNDMDRLPDSPRGRQAFLEPESEYWNVPLMEDESIIERPADQTTITRRYTERAVGFIEENRDRPFFIYLAHNLPHVPLFTSPEFEGHSRRGLYGDVIEEIDWSVGQILESLRDNGLEEDTLVVFTSDNGPWLTFDEHGGSAGLLRDGKGSCWEGGMREPTVFWGPGLVKPGIVHDMGSTLDLFPTIVSLAGLDVPSDRIYDGYDLTPGLTMEGASPRQSMFYYHGNELYAVRSGSYKAHFKTHTAYRGQPHVAHDTPLLFNLDHDPSEKYELQESHPEVLEKIMSVVKDHQTTMIIPPNHLESRISR
jgi:arylsulfatase A-like enzyme